MKHPVGSYKDFKNYIWQSYSPMKSELMSEAHGFREGVHWAMRHTPRFFHTLKTLEKYCPNPKKIVDIGAFPGSFSRICQHYYGSDVAVSACGFPNDGDFPEQLAEKNIEFKNCNIDPDIISQTEIKPGLPYEDASVDLLLGLEVVEHLYSVKTFFEECARILKPGGSLLITTDNIKSRTGLLRLVKDNSTNLDAVLSETSIWSSSEDQWRGHVRFFAANQLVEVGQLVGFEHVDSSAFEHFDDPETYAIRDNSPLAPIRSLLRGNGSRPPIRIRETLNAVRYLGLRSLGSDYGNRIQVLLRKP